MPYKASSKFSPIIYQNFIRVNKKGELVSSPFVSPVCGLDCRLSQQHNTSGVFVGGRNFRPGLLSSQVFISRRLTSFVTDPAVAFQRHVEVVFTLHLTQDVFTTGLLGGNHVVQAADLNDCSRRGQTQSAVLSGSTGAINQGRNVGNNIATTQEVFVHVQVTNLEQVFRVVDSLVDERVERSRVHDVRTNLLRTVTHLSVDFVQVLHGDVCSSTGTCCYVQNNISVCADSSYQTCSSGIQVILEHCSRSLCSNNSCWFSITCTDATHHSTGNVQRTNTAVDFNRTVQNLAQSLRINFVGAGVSVTTSSDAVNQLPHCLLNVITDYVLVTQDKGTGRSFVKLLYVLVDQFGGGRTYLFVKNIQ
ncbi:hypothetical protein vBSenM1_57 [Salmonella phage vB_SenM-1]|uniref:Uncharacterized protein n=1 Tax=Salmonella phage vB_SenM-1 TaxID=2732255 RepID=A0A6M4BEK2_9CAUD|nr:hypothetical protein vBSenM1_57 [Salmonella phage vB_SenM-1]